MTTTNIRTVSLAFMTPGKSRACPADCKRHSADLHKAWSAFDDRRATAATLLAATKVRCACGSTGDWSASVSGTSGGFRCVWAGCPNCGGRAIGIPINAAEYRRWKNLDEADRLNAMAAAINDLEGGRHRSVEIDVESLDSTIDYEFPGDR